MLIKHMAACLVATALVAAPALAQNVGDRPAASDNRTGTLGSPTQNAPGTMAPTGSSSSTMGGATGAGSTAQAPAPAATPATPPAGGSMAMSGGSSMQSLQQGQFLASDLIGTRVVGQNNESIGDVNDVVMGRDGKAMAVIVGVGGFLGIGEKDVAIPFEQAQISFDAAGAGTAAGGTPNATGSTGTAGTAGGTTAGTTATTGAQQSAASNEPQRIVINMTKEQLQQAPAFRSSGSATQNSTSGTAPAGTTTAPRQ